jgi:hypothetical protein
MYLIETLDPDGWKLQGRASLEYWANIEAQTLCCSKGRPCRVRDEETHQVMALVEASSCRSMHASGS